MKIRSFVVGLGLLCGMGGPVQGETVYFSGVAGFCFAGQQCQEFDLGVLPGRPFTGHFTYTNFAYPLDFRDSAAQVSAFVVEFQNITLTATNLKLLVYPHDAERQFVALIGEIPGPPGEGPSGYMTLGVVNTELPPRTDLLSPAGVVFDCLAWGECGFHILRHPVPFPDFIFGATAVTATYRPGEEHGINGAFSFSATPLSFPEECPPADRPRRKAAKKR